MNPWCHCWRAGEGAPCVCSIFNLSCHRQFTSTDGDWIFFGSMTPWVFMSQRTSLVYFTSTNPATNVCIAV